jgi:squalene synthase HpnC
MGALTAAVPATAARSRAATENFPVALRLLPARLRRDLLAVYDVARTVDDAGDDPARTVPERLARLDDLDADLSALAAGRPVRDPAVAALRPTLPARRLPVEPFRRLVEANRLDQSRRRWASWDDLRGYCALSADPVGRVVLGIFAAATPTTEALSDDVCTALQLLEHCQDVGEDLRLRDRVYLPGEDLRRFAVTEDDLASPARTTPPAVRALLAFEVGRAAGLLASGRRLVAELHGWARPAVAGYVAGGLATVDALHRSSYDVLAVDVRPRRRDVVRHLVRLLAARR